MPPTNPPAIKYLDQSNSGSGPIKYKSIHKSKKDGPADIVTIVKNIVSANKAKNDILGPCRNIEKKVDAYIKQLK